VHTASGSLANRTLVISGGSRGIGEAIAVRAARDGANVALIAKTTQPHPRLPGTLYTAAKAIEEAGGHALPLAGDIRDDERITQAVYTAVTQFRGIDIAINNASAIDLADTQTLSMNRYDLMQDVNTRGTFLLSKAAIPHLRRSPNPHILTLSPPIVLDPGWFQTIGVAYTVAKFGMTLAT
jgi:citronellol/citronellal dehydrogenase